MKKVKSTPEKLSPLALLWNMYCGELPRTIRTNPARDRRAAARFKEFTEEEWIDIIKRIAASDFCNGKTTPWRATFDWILQPEVPLKVLEGKYENRGGKNSLNDLVLK